MDYQIQVITVPVSDVEREAGLPGVERQGLVDVADRDGDDLNLVIHQAPAMLR